MRIAVIGTGRQGLACAIDLLREDDLGELRLLDRDREELSCVARRIGDHRVRTESVDAGDEEALAAALRGCDAAISAVPYFLNLAVTRAAIRAHCSMTDIGGNTDVVFQQRSLDEETRAAGVTILPDLGLAPGLGNILAVEAIRGLDETDQVRIRCGGLPLEPGPPLGYTLFFSIHGLLNEYTGQAVCLRESRVTRVPALTERESIRFPRPVGRCEAVHTSGGISTLPWTLEGRVANLDYKTVRYPGHWDRVSFLKEMGLLETKPLKVGRTMLPAREIAAALLEPILDRPGARDVVVLRVTAAGRAGTKRVRRRFDCLEIGDPDGGLTAMMKLTAYPTVAVALDLARGHLRGPGILPAETAVDAGRLIAHLRTRRIIVTKAETVRAGGRKKK